MDKNIIRIKDFPSNTIDEAILILRDNKRAKKFECTSKFKNIDNNEINKNNEEIIIKEAEYIIADYIDENGLDKKDKRNQKIKRLKIANGVLIFGLIISIIF